MFASDLTTEASALIEGMRAQGLKLVTAESCTGGLITALFTEIPGSSDVVERGFVTYSNAAKCEAIGVPAEVISRHGAVSAAVALAMAEGALKHSRANIAVAATGIAGPGGGSEQKPVGLVYLAVERKGEPANVQRFAFGDVGRSRIRLASLKASLDMIRTAIG